MSRLERIHLNCIFSHRLVKSKDPTNASVTANALESKLPYMLWFLANSDDDVSGTIAPFAHEYVTLLKQSLPLNPNQKEFIKVRHWFSSVNIYCSLACLLIELK
jgi:hypothetical protein